MNLLGSIIVIGAFACSIFSRPKSISVRKSKNLSRQGSKIDLKKHLSLSVAVGGLNPSNRIPRLNVGGSVVVVTNEVSA